jgi:hypothetical protein
MAETVFTFGDLNNTLLKKMQLVLARDADLRTAYQVAYETAIQTADRQDVPTDIMDVLQDLIIAGALTSLYREDSAGRSRMLALIQALLVVSWDIHVKFSDAVGIKPTDVEQPDSLRAKLVAPNPRIKQETIDAMRARATKMTGEHAPVTPDNDATNMGNPLKGRVSV